MDRKLMTAKLLKMNEGISGTENNPEIREKLNPFGYTDDFSLSRRIEMGLH